MKDIYDDYVHLVRLALEGQEKDVVAIAKRSVQRITKIRPDLVESLKHIIANYNINSKAIRGGLQQPVPIDIDSKLELLHKEFVILDKDPVWSEAVWNEINAVIEERKHEDELIRNGLTPTRSILFIGPPGVGKTLAAKWLSSQLQRPLFTLDLAAVMSSFLGRTGNNIRSVLNYAQRTSSVLLLDEFDAVAKRRNDDSEVGELKRLVNVLLQAVDEWPATGLLIAATNHPELLDPAVWRRFERVVEFPYPSRSEIQHTMNELLEMEKSNELIQIIDILSYLFEGNSYAEIARQINLARKNSIVFKRDLVLVLDDLAKRLFLDLEKSKKLSLAKKLISAGLSQRKVSEMTGVSRDTLRKYNNDLQQN